MITEKLKRIPILQDLQSLGLVIKPDECAAQKMVMLVHGKHSQRHVSSHYNFDVWEFAPGSCDEFIRGGYGPYEAAEEFLLSFQRESSGEVTSVVWRIGGDDVVFTRATL